jgi:hypothetical protein
MSATDDLIKQILASSNTSKWTGEGFGSAEKNAADMAKILNEIGITDIKQFGKVPEYQRAEVQYGVNGQVARQDEDGNYYIMASGGTDSEGNQINYRQSVDPKDLQKIYGYYSNEGEATRFVPADQSKVNVKDGVPLVQVGENFGNKLTGQAVKNTYGERQTGDFFGGTFSGKGNTAYGARLDAQGNPIFYTQGASSNDLAQIMQMAGPAGQIGMAIATGGLSIPQQIAARFAMNVLSGQDVGDAVKGAAISYAMANIPGTDVMKESSKFLNKLDDSGVLSSAFKNATMSGARALVMGQDVGQAMLTGAATGGVNGALNALMDTDEFKGLTSGLSAAQKKLVVNAATGVMSGKPLDQIIINSAMSAARDAALKAQTENQVLDPYFKSMGSKVAGAEDTIELPGGIRLAGTSNNIFSDAGNGIFRTDVGGSPLFAESKGAESLRLPFGTRLMSSTEEVEEIDPDTGKTVYKKPEGSYYDPTINAWLVKEDASQMFSTSKILDDISLFNSSQGNLKDVASKTESTSDDYLADFLNSIGINSTTDLSNRNYSNQDILDLIGYKGDGVDTANVTDKRVTPDASTDDGKVIVTGKRETDSADLDFDPTRTLTPTKITDMGNEVITAKRLTPKQELDLSVDPIKLDVPDLKLDDILADITKTDDKTKVTTPTKVTVPTKVTTPTPDTLTYVPTGAAPPPSQDPYAKVKFMEDIFGPELSNQFLTDVSMQTPKTNDIEALLRVLRG